MFATGWERVVNNQLVHLFQRSFQQTMNILIAPIYKQIIALLISGGLRKFVSKRYKKQKTFYSFC